MRAPIDDTNSRMREIIERPIAELAALGLEGGVAAAQHMLALQMILRLCLADDRERLESLRDEIDDYFMEEDDEPARPSLRLVE